MFGMGMTEILLVLAIALVAIGPKRLPGLARALGRGLAEFRKATDEIQRTIYEDVRKPLSPKEFLKDLEANRAYTPPETQTPAAAPHHHQEPPVDPEQT